MSNTLKRILIGIIGIPLILYITYIGGIAFFIFCLVVQSLCFYEFLKMFKEKNYLPYLYPSIIFSAITITAFVYFNEYFKFISLSVFLVFVLTELIGKKDNKAMNVGIVLFGMAYITFPFAMLYVLDKNYILVYLLFLLIWANDSFAFFGGKYFGKHKFSKISPNKTVEGLISGFIFTVTASYVFHLYIPEVTLTDSLVVGVLISTLGPAGDLFESFLKRYTGIKDSSHIIPGHGGLLDRFDSLIFCVPFIFIYFKYVKYLIN